MASLALPNLYSSQEFFAAEITDTSDQGIQRPATLWRTIILSCHAGQTAFPYCLWMRSLFLGELLVLLKCMEAKADVRAFFFGGAMAPYNLVLQPESSSQTGAETTAPHSRRRRRHNQPPLDTHRICHRVGEDITQYIKAAAERDNCAATLTLLESQYIPMDVLPTWTSRLTMLTSLIIHDGSVIGEQAAVAIRDNCPQFCELTCHSCDGPSFDEDMGAFLRTIRPNSLSTFFVGYDNSLGHEALEALSLHASSLKKLRLSGLRWNAFAHLGPLRSCTALAELFLEANSTQKVENYRRWGVNWTRAVPDLFANLVAWLSNARKLVDLTVKEIPWSLRLLTRVLKSPHLQLKALELVLLEYCGFEFDDDDDDHHDDAYYDEDDIGSWQNRFYVALGHQTKLERLVCYGEIDEYDDLDAPAPEHMQLLRSIAKSGNLRVLDIADENLNDGGIKLLADSLPNLETFSFGGVCLGDPVLALLLKMHKLTTINITGISMFTFPGLVGYISLLHLRNEKMAPLSASPRKGIRLRIKSQAMQYEILPNEVEFLAENAKETGVGEIIIHHTDCDPYPSLYSMV